MSKNMRLERLARKAPLKRQRLNRVVFEGLVRLGRNYLADARRAELSSLSRFQLAHGAAHAFSLAALRWHGYGSEDGRLIFRSLRYALDVPLRVCRLLASCEERVENLENASAIAHEDFVATVLATADDLSRKVSELSPPN